MSDRNSSENRFNNLNALLGVMLMSLREYRTQAENYQKFVYIISALLVASGVFHMGTFLLADEPWAGPVSWRKPIVFDAAGSVKSSTLCVTPLSTDIACTGVAFFLQIGTKVNEPKP